ncbi:MAG: hypothetical protein JWL73_1106 [Actinomycetia bacterium]|nr:hypothetical protein [Actinomycetes bacterium]
MALVTGREKPGASVSHMATEQRVSTCKLDDVNELLAMWNTEGWMAVSIDTWVAAATPKVESHTRATVLFQRETADG